MRQFLKKKIGSQLFTENPSSLVAKTTILNSFFLGPRKPLFFVPSTPEASPNTSSSSWEKFPEDTSILESESENGDTTLDLVNKMVGHKPA